MTLEIGDVEKRDTVRASPDGGDHHPKKNKARNRKGRIVMSLD